jgi:HEAT repeat protein
MAKITSSRTGEAVSKLLTAAEVVDLLTAPAQNYIPIVKRIKRDAAVRELIGALQSSTADSRVSQILCDVLGARRAQRAVPILQQMLAHPDDGVRGAAAEALGKIGNVNAGAALAHRLSVEQRSGIRRALIVAIGAVHYLPAVAQLVDALADPDPLTRRMAAWALGELPAEDARAPLEQALARETDPLSHHQMSESLKRLVDALEKT